MKITLSPVRRADPITVSKQGDILTVNGTPFDFTPIPEGATLPADAIDSEFFSGPVERINGELHLTLMLPHGPNAPEETKFPVPITVLVDGPIALPAYSLPDPEPVLIEEPVIEGAPE